MKDNIWNTKKTGITLSYEPDKRKYPGQQCQNDNINEEFRKLHENIINQIIEFCNKHNITVDEIHLNADGVAGSIPYGSWQACTDSYFGLEKFTEDYKKACSLEVITTKEEFKKLKLKQEPYIYSM